MTDKWPAVLALGGRALISVLFISAGINKVMNWSGTVMFMDMQGMIMIPFFLCAAIVIEIGCGLCLLVGFQTRVAALALFLFLVPVTFIFHGFWNYPPDKQGLQIIMLFKNLAIMGGLLMLAAMGPGPLSFDLRQKAKQGKVDEIA